MNPAVFLVILCLAGASAVESPDVTVDVKDQEEMITNEKPVKEEQRRAMWEEFMKKIEQGNKEISLEKDNVNQHINVFDGLIPEEFKKEMNEPFFTMFEEEEKTQTQPVDDFPKFEDWAGSGDTIPVQDQSNMDGNIKYPKSEATTVPLSQSLLPQDVSCLMVRKKV